MIKFEKACFSYGDTVILNEFSAEFTKNSINCILGPSGCGKTTVLNLLAGNLVLQRGSLTGTDKNVSYVFQEDRLIPEMTVYKNLDFILKQKIPDKAERREVIYKNLKDVGLEKAGELYLRQLSGGMAQRVSLARAFAYPSTTILMDEPLKGLDTKTKGGIEEVFFKLWESDRRTTFFVTHDIDEGLLVADEIFVFSDKPLRIINRYRVNTPKGAGKLYDSEFVRIKTDIYRDIENYS
ncbi:MAG: ABC transporter ATP-binding protein [Clostridiales bacterium]|jgi:NitT/TauT family transport system ATP-binding protein|nr:ABC transporter ATP-binding protein [Clostridiales bacterium]